MDDLTNQDNLDLGTDEVSLDIDSEGELSLSDDESDSGLTILDRALGFDKDDLTIEDDDDSNLIITDDEVLDLDELRGSEDTIEVADQAASVIRRDKTDISHDFISYFEIFNNAYTKIVTTTAKTETSYSKPAFAEFGFIYDPIERQKVYGFFCKMLEDLVSRDEYRDLTENDAYDTMLSAMYNEIQYIPNIHESKVHRIFISHYEKNKKLAQAHIQSENNTLSSLVDRRNMEEARLVYYLNSIPFDVVSRFFAKPELQNSRNTIAVNDFGVFIADYRQRNNVRNVTHGMVVQAIIEYLTSTETLLMMDLDEEARIELSIGELLRRFVVHELLDQSFVVRNMKNLKQGKELVDQLRDCLINAMNTGSIAAEMLYLILVLIQDNIRKNTDLQDFYVPYVSNIARYLRAFVHDSAYINPVYYSFVELLKDNEEGREYDLGYFLGDNFLHITTKSLLCEVIGDNQQIYHIPLVMHDSEHQCVICPPVEIVRGLRGVTLHSRLSIDGNICYTYTPSYAWLSSLSISAESDVKESTAAANALSNASNPLLDILLHYTNDFDESGEQPKVMAVESPEYCNFIGVTFPNSQTTSIFSLKLPAGVVKLKHGTCASDTDGSLIVRYISMTQPGEEYIVIPANEFNTVKVEETVVEGDENNLLKFPELNVIINTELDADEAKLPKEYADFRASANDNYSCEVVKRICDLNALDYNAELESVRNLISRDLGGILGFDFIHTVLGLRIADLFVDLATKNNGELDNFNFGTLQDLLDFVYGKDHCLRGQIKMTKELLEELKQELQQVKETDGSLKHYLERLDTFDMHILALQALSRNELQGSDDTMIYKVINTIPEVHKRMRKLENQMVLIRALSEVEQDIASVFLKTKPIRNANMKVCTLDNIFLLEKDLQRGMRSIIKEQIPDNIPLPKVGPCFTATEKVLHNRHPESCAILKYFILEGNAYGTLTELEECFGRGDESYNDLYQHLREAFGVTGDEPISNMSEIEFRHLVPRELVNKVFVDFHKELAEVVGDGLISEVGNYVDLQVIRSYDMITTYGRYMFNLSSESREDLTDTSEYYKWFNKYLGSFIISYAPIVGEAADEIDGGMDSYGAYMKHRSDFITFVDLSTLEKYDLQDLKYIFNPLEDAEEEEQQQSLIATSRV